jgi:hypothetical protein
MIPEDALDQIRRWADRRVPEHARDQVLSRRTSPSAPSPSSNAARRGGPSTARTGPGSRSHGCATRSLATDGLYWRDRNLKFHEYDLVEPTPDIQDLLDEIDRDPTSIFWG